MKKTLAIAVVLALMALVIYAVARTLLDPSNHLSPAYNLGLSGKTTGSSDQDGSSVTTNESLPLEVTIHCTKGGFGAVRARVARTDAEQELGLSGFPSLAPDEGMLFPFANPGIYSFWMKDMNFPIDMVWLKKVSGAGSAGSTGRFELVYLAENAQPSGYPNETFASVEEADAVLEVPAFAAKRLGFEVHAGTVEIVPDSGAAR